jgi:predicted RNase H-like HicB family nuclease
MKQSETNNAIIGRYVCSLRCEPEGGYTVKCSAFPEIVSYAATSEEARRNAHEAIELCLEVYREKGWPLPRSESDVL